MNHSPHLKSYVKKHPDNKMAWYLLGKEYESSGQEGKANYCFNRAGEVFEAFEHKQIPADVWMEYQDKLVQMSKEKERRTARTRHLLTALMVLLLIWVPSANSPRPSNENTSVPSGTEQAAIDILKLRKWPLLIRRRWPRSVWLVVCLRLKLEKGVELERGLLICWLRLADCRPRLRCWAWSKGARGCSGERA